MRSPDDSPPPALAAPPKRARVFPGKYFSFEKPSAAAENAGEAKQFDPTPQPRPGKRRHRRSRHRGRIRKLRIHARFTRRRFRRFHDRFTARQILGFCIGVPAGISLALCLVFLLVKPPAGVTPSTAPQRQRPVFELVQRLQEALFKHDSRSAHLAVEELEKLYPKEARTLVARGTLSAHEKSYGDARKSYLEALEIAPELPPALINLGEVEFAAGDYARAAGYYERAAARLPNNLFVQFRLYLCYSLLNDRSKAEVLGRDFANRTSTVEWYFIQASEALRAGKSPEAQRYVATAKLLFGERAEAYRESLKKIGWLK